MPRKMAVRLGQCVDKSQRRLFSVLAQVEVDRFIVVTNDQSHVNE